MDDSISRQDAIDMLEMYPFTEYGDYEEAREVINRLPSAQPEPITVNIDHELTQEECEKLRKDISNAPIMLSPSAQQWIPCSERLPSEKDGQVLVTKRGEVRIATYSEFSGTWYAGEMCAVGGEDPIAWTPLPEPYKNDYCSFGERAKE